MSLHKRLEVGEHVLSEGAVYRVALVNECRARLELVSGHKRVRDFDVTDKETGRMVPVHFEEFTDKRSINVSPHAAMERVQL